MIVGVNLVFFIHDYGIWKETHHVDYKHVFALNVIFNALAYNLLMLILSSMLLDWGVGFAN